MFFEKWHVKSCFVGKWLIYVAEQVNGYQTATIIRTKRNFAARVSGNGFKSVAFVAIGNCFTVNGIPKKDTWFSGFPRIINNFVPQLAGIDSLNKFRFS